MARQITDMLTWLLDNDDRIFRYLVYKKVFTPYEQEKAFMDESEYENGGYYTMCIIEEAIDLGNGDHLLGLREIADDGMIFKYIRFLRLSEIRLSCFDDDQSIKLYERNSEEDDEL